MDKASTNNAYLRIIINKTYTLNCENSSKYVLIIELNENLFALHELSKIIAYSKYKHY